MSGNSDNPGEWSFDYKILIKTGDRKNAGTDANVKIRLHDTEGNTSPQFALDVLFRNDFERGNVDVFHVGEKGLLLGQLDQIEIARDSAGLNPDWYVDVIEVEDNRLRKSYVFPVHRWVEADRSFYLKHLDAVLPQDEVHKGQRESELQRKRSVYEYKVLIEGLPTQIKKLPDDEQFSDDNQRDIDVVRRSVKTELLLIKLLTIGDTGTTFDSLEKLYGRLSVIDRPLSMDHWRTDTWFGAQRLQSGNPAVIRRCTRIPYNKFGITNDMVEPFLEGLSIDEAIGAKRLYICDYEILNGIEAKTGFQIVRPIGLFFVNDAKDLVPVAIQLHQEKGENNPVFLPSDHPNAWLFAKMWYNVADSSIHQALTHLGYTHLIVEAIAVCAHRNLSPSHPIFKLMAPHFLFMMAINERARTVLMQEGGLLDSFVALGGRGALELAAKGFQTWRLNVEGHLLNDLKERGVDDVDALPNYHYRDDAIPIWHGIKTYVEKVVNIYYDSDEKLKGDHELQQWAKELILPHPNGIGLKGVPGEGQFETKEPLIETLTCTIFRSSVAHAAANFYQYDDYAFQPNFPMHLRGDPPTDKTPPTEEEMFSALADKDIVLQIIAAAKTLSFKATEALGTFEHTYLFHPRALEAATELRAEMVLHAKTIRERNKTRKYPYGILDPEFIPNSISI